MIHVFTYSAQLYQDQEIFSTSRFSRNIPQFYKPSYTAAVRYERIPNCSVCIAQSKQKMASGAGNSPRLTRAIIMSHTQCARLQ